MLFVPNNDTTSLFYTELESNQQRAYLHSISGFLVVTILKP